MKFSRIHSSLLLLTLIVVSFSCEPEKVKSIDLSGEWRFQIDSLDVGGQEEWFAQELNGSIKLPGSMAEHGKGNDISLETNWTGSMWNDSLWYKSEKYAEYRQPGNIKVSFWLSPAKVYTGPAWYQREVNIPEGWKDNNIFLNLERAHWETTVWVDDLMVGSKNTLATPHNYNLGKYLSPGKHLLTIRVDNRIKDIDVGVDAHSVTDNTQTNWNGLVGDIELVAKPKVYIDQVRVNPDVDAKKVTVELNIINISGSAKEIEIGLSADLIHGEGESVPSKKQKFTIEGEKEVSITYPMGENPALWDEFNPNVYEMKVTLNSDAGEEDSKTVSFGMREFKVEGKHFTINDRPVFLRGTLECAIFPLTGYPPTDKESWARIFKIIKNHGLNHMRFHSWCPPEAAFDAADEAGVYLQVEASAWATIGDGKPIDKWLYKEAQHILDAYGNHPSFVMMAYGNEPHGENHKEYLTKFVEHFKKQDSTKVWTGGTGWTLIENADFFVSAAPRIQHWGEGLKSIINSKPPQTVFDYDDIIQKTPMPHVAHEIGQWCVYPNFEEMSKYTGVLKPKNFQIFKETLNENHLGDLADEFLMASGELQVLCYKADIEAALRTKGMAGFQLLDLHDFPGQGTALIGVLDAFWDQKGYVSPEEFRSFSGHTVPLVRLEQRTFLNTDSLTAAVEIAHFGRDTLKAVPEWKITYTDGTVFSEGKLPEKTIPIGNGIKLGEIAVDLKEIKKARMLNLSVSVGEYTNNWDIWVYPAEKPEIPEADFRIVQELDANTINYLNNGGKVLLNPSKGSVVSGKGGDIGIGFSSIFWNTSWTKGQKPHTLGILCDPDHPALAKFPTEYHSNWQWWDAMTHSDAIILDEFDPNLKPIVRIIDDWFENRRLALLFEVKVGKGKLLVSGVDLHTNLENRKPAQQMLFSLKNYMASDDFNPQHEVEIEQILELYRKSI